MADYKEIDRMLKNNCEITDLGYNKGKMRNLLLDLLEYRVDNFKYVSKNDYSYLLKIFDYFPYYFQENLQNKKEFYLRIKNIRNKVKDLLVQKPGNISKNSCHFQFLKNLIDNLETISLSFLYDYIDKYDGSKYDFINFLVFEIKRIDLLEDALRRFPYIVNFENKEGNSLINNVIGKYIEEVDKYTDNEALSGLDDIIYYDEVLKLILSSSKLTFSILDKKRWIGYISNLINNVDNIKYNSLTKQKYIFFLNDLCNLINGFRICDLDYLEYKYDIKNSFNQSIKMECDRILNFDYNKKRNIINDIIITVDGVDAKEIDDALSIKKLANGNFLLGIHIADPLYFFNNNSIIYDEARRRTTSIYLSDLTIPMLPKKISSDYSNLLENKKRPATSYYYEITLDGEIVNYKFYKSYITVYKNMTYTEFNNILINGCDDLNIYNSVNDLAVLQPILSKLYNIDPYYAKVNRSDNNITDTNIIGNSFSEKLIESAMVFNNQMVAQYFFTKKLPFIYRIHAIDEKTMSKISEFSQSISVDDSKSEYSKYINMLKNIYPKATYSLDNKGHFGLGLNSYTHITSPLRRFADIVSSDCLNKMYFNSFTDKDIYKYEDYLTEIINSINQKRLSIEVFSTNYEKNKCKKL